MLRFKFSTNFLNFLKRPLAWKELIVVNDSVDRWHILEIFKVDWCNMQSTLHTNNVQLTFTCSTSTQETLKKMWNMFKVCNRSTKNCDVIDVVLVFLLLTLNIFRIFFECFYCWLWISKYCSKLDEIHHLYFGRILIHLLILPFP